MSGATCSVNNPIPLSPFTVYQNSVGIPQLTNGQMLNLPSPVIGMMVYNTSSSCMSIYNGLTWNCMMITSSPNPTVFSPAVFGASASYSTVVLTTLPYTLTNQHNYVVYTGVAGTLTIPTYSFCIGRLYKITNYGTGIITLSTTYTNSNSGTSNTINPNTSIHIIATTSGWYKVN